MPELALRVTAGGARSWAVSVQEGHGRRDRRLLRITLGRASQLGLAQARDEARQVLERVAHGLPARPARGPLTVADLVTRALGALHLSPSTRHEWERLARVEIVPALGSRAAAELQRAEVRAWMRETAARPGWISDRAFEVLRWAYS